MTWKRASATFCAAVREATYLDDVSPALAHPKSSKPWAQPSCLRSRHTHAWKVIPGDIPDDAGHSRDPRARLGTARCDLAHLHAVQTDRTTAVDARLSGMCKCGERFTCALLECAWSQSALLEHLIEVRRAGAAHGARWSDFAHGSPRQAFSG